MTYKLESFLTLFFIFLKVRPWRTGPRCVPVCRKESTQLLGINRGMFLTTSPSVQSLITPVLVQQILLLSQFVQTHHLSQALHFRQLLLHQPLLQIPQYLYF